MELARESRAGGDLETRMGQQEAGDVAEARVDVLPDGLQLLVLSILDLKGNTGRKMALNDKKVPISASFSCWYVFNDLCAILSPLLNNSVMQKQIHVRSRASASLQPPSL